MLSCRSLLVLYILNEMDYKNTVELVLVLVLILVLRILRFVVELVLTLVLRILVLHC